MPVSEATPLHAAASCLCVPATPTACACAASCGQCSPMQPAPALRSAPSAGGRWLLRAAPLQPQVTTPPALACSTNTAADLLLTKYAAATDDLTRAKLLRALLMSSCGGDFNPLFSVSLSLAAFNPMGSRVWLCLLHTVAGRGDGEEELPCTPSRPVISAMFCTASMPGQVAGATTHGVAPCAGPHPQGDGLTWTGMGGLLSPLGEEFIAPPQSLQGADYKFVSFCINGVTGSPLQPGGSCPLPA